MFNDAHILDRLPAYSLGTLDPDEARLVADHLAECFACRDELATYQSIAGQLALLAPTAEPPADLKSRLMQRIDQLEMRSSPRVEPKRTERPTGWRLFPAGAAAALLLIVVLAVSNVMLWQRLNHLEVISGPLGMRAIALQNTGPASLGSAFVVMGADGENGVLVVDKMPQLQESQEYQVWLVRDSVNTSGGTFTVDEDGYRGLRLDAPDSLLSYSSVFVTVEPVGGSTHPTGAQVLNGSLFNP